MTIPDEAVQAARDAIQETEFADVPTHENMVRALTAALPFLTGVKVKEMEWVDRGETVTHQYKVDTICGVYYIERNKAGLFDWWSSTTSGKHEAKTIEAAKAAAQADYEARILSAIEVAPSPRAQALEEVGSVRQETIDGVARGQIGLIHPVGYDQQPIELVTRSQAEAIIAAKDEARSNWKKLALHLQTDNAALTERIKELADERYKLAYAITGGEDATGYLDSLSVETLVEVARKNTQHWFAETDRADTAETKLAAFEKQLSKDRKLRNEAQCDADLWRFSVDMGDHPSLLVKVWKQRKALETQLAAARKALRNIAEDKDAPFRIKVHALAALETKP